MSHAFEVLLLRSPRRGLPIREVEGPLPRETERRPDLRLGHRRLRSGLTRQRTAGPTSGSLVIAGEGIHAMSRSRLAAWRSTHVGYIFQLYNLVPVLTAYENVELPLLLQPISARERHRRVSSALDVVGIADRHAHYPRQLSGGQEQRVAIARAIVTEPTILLADEPTGDLDRESATAVMNLLSTLNKEHGRTIVMVTHDAKTTEWADTVLHLEKGRLIEEGVAS